MLLTAKSTYAKNWASSLRHSLLSVQGGMRTEAESGRREGVGGCGAELGSTHQLWCNGGRQPHCGHLGRACGQAQPGGGIVRRRPGTATGWPRPGSPTSPGRNCTGPRSTLPYTQTIGSLKGEAGGQDRMKQNWSPPPSRSELGYGGGYLSVVVVVGGLNWIKCKYLIYLSTK